MDLKVNSQDKLIAFLEKQQEEEVNLERYYEKCLAELKEGKKDGDLMSSISQVENTPNLTKVRTKSKRVKTEEVSSIMEESMVSINLKQSPKNEKHPSKKQVPSFEMQYLLLSKEINKLIDSICNKDASPFKKTPTITPKKTLTTRSNIKVPTQTQVSLFKLTGNLSSVSNSKTEREQVSQNERSQQLSELGDLTIMVSNDQVVIKLISNLRLEEERFIDALLYRTQMSATSKMKNYLNHLCEKNEQTLFKLKQNAIDRSLSRLESNKETVRNGYTPAMKELIERGLRGKEGKNI